MKMKLRRSCLHGSQDSQNDNKLVDVSHSPEENVCVCTPQIVQQLPSFCFNTCVCGCCRIFNVFIQFTVGLEIRETVESIQ